MLGRLPRDTTGTFDCDDVPRCPWCGCDPGEATFTLSQLVEAQAAGLMLGFLPRNPDGTAPEGALEVDCPSCVRPFAVALQSRSGWRYVRLVAVRTPADVRLLERGR